MKRIAILSTAISLVFFGPSNGQGTKIIYFDNNVIMSFDYANQNIDTLLNMQGGNAGYHEEAAIDDFNGRCFFCGYMPGDTGLSAYSFDITSKALTKLFPYDPYILEGMEYDCFTNSIIYRTHDSIMSFDILSGHKSSICIRPLSTNNVGILARYTRSYNYLNSTLWYLDYLNAKHDLYAVSINLTTGALIDTILHPSGTGISSIAYDHITNSFYGEGSNGAGDNGFVYRIDSISGAFIKVCDRPLDYDGILNSQNAVFDSYNGFYLTPFYTNHSQNKFAIVNVYNSAVTIIDSFPEGAHDNHLYSEQNALIKIQNNTIIASYAATYEWYLNNTLIADANTQTFSPTVAGGYKVKETHLDGRISTSNVVFMKPIGVQESDLNHSNSFSISPNPFSNQTTLKITDDLIGATLSIYNSSGKLVNQIININDKSITINRGDLPNGLYFLRLTQDNKIIFANKFVIAD